MSLSCLRACSRSGCGDCCARLVATQKPKIRINKALRRKPRVIESNHGERRHDFTLRSPDQSSYERLDSSGLASNNLLSGDCPRCGAPCGCKRSSCCKLMFSLPGWTDRSTHCV